MAFCLHCGERLPDGATRCASCGSPVESAESELQQTSSMVPSDPGLTAKVRQLARQGQTIQAIKEYREVTGASLQNAKEAVEGWMRGGESQSPSAVSIDPGLTDNVRQLARQGHKIQAIKEYREATGASLKTSKDAIESWMKSEGVAGSSGAGCGTSVLLLLLLGVGLAVGLW
jgi:ribosomal protein L7/L12